MNLIEFIGFVVSFIAMTFLFFRGMIEKRQKAKNPALYEKRQLQREQRLEDFFRTFDVQHDEEVAGDEGEDEEDELDLEELPSKREQVRQAGQLPLPPLKVNARLLAKPLDRPRESVSGEARAFESSIEKQHSDAFLSKIPSTNAVDHALDPYAIALQSRQNRFNHLLGHLDSKKDLVIIHEVLAKPKALQ